MVAYEYHEDGGHVEELEATTLEAAREEAEELLRGGDWGQDEDGFAGARVSAAIYELDEEGDSVYVESVTIDLLPVEPACLGGGEHDLTSEGMGGCDENPGVWAGGGTTVITRQRCRRCGGIREKVTHGVQRNPGEADTVEWSWPE